VRASVADIRSSDRATQARHQLLDLRPRNILLGPCRRAHGRQVAATMPALRQGRLEMRAWDQALALAAKAASDCDERFRGRFLFEIECCRPEWPGAFLDAERLPAVKALRLGKMFRVHGWPGRGLVGDDGAYAGSDAGAGTMRRAHSGLEVSPRCRSAGRSFTIAANGQSMVLRMKQSKLVRSIEIHKMATPMDRALLGSTSERPDGLGGRGRAKDWVVVALIVWAVAGSFVPFFAHFYGAGSACRAGRLSRGRRRSLEGLLNGPRRPSCCRLPCVAGLYQTSTRPRSMTTAPATPSGAARCSSRTVPLFRSSTIRSGTCTPAFAPIAK
jgi:hypothetical protein